ncbi:unnamed protein product [Fusarium equiseti]|uniref:Uncharacterized protein n=1 Tax=Fusarium equiseti TaxID=61235 RepID=A0A8J2N988_FUSEQ|nr:unnamed protein product [Fusarium equiseti]
MFQNGKRPVFCNSYHQADVIEVKAISLYLINAAPHTTDDGPAVPCLRHMRSFTNARAPRTPNFNPDDKRQSMKPASLKERESFTDDQIDLIERQYRSRPQALLGVDEMV